MRFLLLVFIIIPIVEMLVLIEVGGLIGTLNTIFLVLLTAGIGVMLLRQQGFSTLMRAQEKLSYGEIPASEMLEGLVLAVGGALLLTPGFVTDAVGFACLIAPARRALIKQLLRSAILGLAPPGLGPFRRGNGANKKSTERVFEGEYQAEGKSNQRPTVEDLARRNDLAGRKQDNQDPG